MAQTPLGEVANLRLLLEQQRYPGSRQHDLLARHVIECYAVQKTLISSRDNGPGVDTGDILCEGYVTRAAVLPDESSDPWDWLALDLPWQRPGFRAIVQPPEDPQTGLADPPTTVNNGAIGVLWAGDLSLLTTPPTLPRSAHAVFAGCTLLMVGARYGSGGIGLIAQPEIGERITFALKPASALVIKQGDSLQLIADRYGTTVQTLRKANPAIEGSGYHLTVAGDSLNVLSAQYGTTPDWLRKYNPSLLRADGHTTDLGDTLKQLAIDYDTTVDWLRQYNPDYDRWPRSDPLPVGVVLDVPSIRPSDELDIGQTLVVPLLRPSTTLPAGGWIYLPSLRGISYTDDLWDVDLTPEPPAPAGLVLNAVASSIAL